MAEQQPTNTPVEHLPLGEDAMGRRWTLDLGTGAINAESNDSPVEGDNTEIVPASAITGAWLSRVLAEGGWSATRESEEQDAPRCSVVTEIGTVTISAKQGGRWVRVERVYRWNTRHADWGTTDARGLGTEELNRAAFVVKFATTEEPAKLSAAFDIPTHAGITRAQFLQYLRRVVLETSAALDYTGIAEVVE